MKLKRSLKRLLYQKADATKLLLSMVFIVLVFVPLACVFAAMDLPTLRTVVSSPGFGASIGHSLMAAGLTTVIVVVLAYGLAVCTERTSLRFRGLFSIIFSVPMLIPSVSHGMGLIILLGNNGLLTRWLGINVSIYGLPGIVMGSVLYALPVAYLMIVDVMKYEDGAPHEAACVLGIPAWRRF